MRLNEMFRKPRVSESLELLKGAVIKLSSGSELSQTELGVLNGLTVTAEEINRAADVSVQHEIVTAAKTITDDESKSTFYLDAAAGFALTLPAPALGLEYTFVVRTAPTSNGYDIATNGGSDILKGTVHEANSATGAVDQNADNLNLAANVALPGDWVKVVSDGTSWFFSGQVQANGGVVASTT